MAEGECSPLRRTSGGQPLYCPVNDRLSNFPFPDTGGCHSRCLIPSSELTVVGTSPLATYPGQYRSPVEELLLDLDELFLGKMVLAVRVRSLMQKVRRIQLDSVEDLFIIEPALGMKHIKPELPGF